MFLASFQIHALGLRKDYFYPDRQGLNLTVPLGTIRDHEKSLTSFHFLIPATLQFPTVLVVLELLEF